MTEGMIGAAPEELRALAKTMESSGAALKTLSGTLHSAISQARWTGPDSERFRSQWNNGMRMKLRSTGESLAGYSSMLVAQAAEQEQASSDTGGAVSGGAVSGGAGLGGAAGPAGPGTPGGSPFWDPSNPGWTIGGSLGDQLGLDFGAWNTGLGVVAGALGVASGIKLLQAEKGGLLAATPKLLSWLRAAKLAEGVQGAGVLRALNAATRIGQAGSVLGIGMGAMDIYSGLQQGDGYRTADGVITTVLSGAALIPGPVGWVAAGLGAGWAIGQYFSGDVPLSKRIVDFGKSVGQGTVDVVNKIGDAGGKVLDDVGKGASKAWHALGF
ncbi:MAG: hypothetical protein WBX27_09410 [Specibacter sp.]